MLVSPTEQHPVLRALGRSSLVPEEYGCDFLFASAQFGLVGIQRKELNDLVNSVKDGRLAKELGQMKRLGLALLIVEGKPIWTNDGLLTSTSTQWSISQHLGTLWSVQLSGCWIASSQGVIETSTLISAFTRWTSKPRHSSLMSRPNQTADEWGKVGSREWSIHLLQGFRGMGPVRAAALIDHFKGVPLQWTVGVDDLMEVPGVGRKFAETLLESLGDNDVLDWTDITSIGENEGS